MLPVGWTLKRALTEIGSHSEQSRERACRTLWRYRAPQATRALVMALGDVSSRVRAVAAQGLGHRRAASAVSALKVPLRTDSSGTVRAMCAVALRSIDTKDAMDALAGALDDTDARVVQAAAAALGESGDATYAAALRSALGHPTWVGRFCVCDALVRLGKVDSSVLAVAVALDQSPEAHAWNESVLSSNRERLDQDPGPPLQTTHDLVSAARAAARR